MSSSPTIVPALYRALTLRERVALPGQPSARVRDEDAALGALRVQRHRALPGFGSPQDYARRLAALGLTVPQAQALMSESGPSLAERCPEPPPWATMITRAFGGTEPLEFRGETLAAVATPLVDLACAAITEAAQRHASAADTPFDPQTVAEVLTSRLQAQLGTMAERTLVLEMHVARLRGLIEGDDGRTRFSSYLRRLAEPGTMMAIFEEYPVLARVLATHTQQSIAAAQQLIERLCADWPRLVDALGMPERPGALTVALSSGDRHDDGRAVTLLRWAGGAELAYKPKPLAVDARVQTLFSWCNQHGAAPPLATLRMLDRGDYGWSEVVRPQGCETAEQIEAFFERQGALLGLFYGMLATDFHCENVIAVGAHPYPVDLESLFQARIGDGEAVGVDAVSEADLVYSVLRVGLLPERANEANGAPGIDLSGLGGNDGQLSPFAQPVWEAAGTDQMALTRRHLPLEGSANRPTLDGAATQAFEWTDAIERGFTRMYRLLLEHRESLGADGGVLDGFADDLVRVIARPTRVYAALLGESYHPDLLRDAVDRDIFFDRLCSLAPGREHLRPLVELEHRDLWRGDIPKFMVRADGHDLLHPGGVVPGLFETSGLALTKQHLAGLDDRDLAHQQWIVRASMVTVATDVRAGRWARYRPDLTVAERTAEQLTASAARIADHLVETALKTGDEATWLGLAFRAEHWVLAPLGTDLYGGVLGVALFLAHAAVATGRPHYRQLAEAAIRALIRKEAEAGQREPSIGGYSGHGAMIYGLTQLGTLWERSDLIELAQGRVSWIDERIDADETLDVLSGSSGAIAGLLTLHARTGDTAAVDVATRCAQRLIERAVPMGTGVGWPSAETGGRALAGFSHGAGGMAWALLRLYEVTADPHLRQTALAAIEYERTLFVPDEGNYYDLRPESLAGKDAQFSFAWCHGAPGVGLARVGQLHLLDPEARHEVRRAAESTARALGRGHSLCHGDLGNLELVWQAGRVLDDAGLAAKAQRGIAAAVDHGEREGWLCGVPLSIETPSLMVGLAGIGYQLLRFSAPRQVPSVLLLEPLG